MTEITKSYDPESLVAEWRTVEARSDENPIDFVEESRQLALLQYQAQRLVDESVSDNAYRLFRGFGIPVERKNIFVRILLAICAYRLANKQERIKRRNDRKKQWFLARYWMLESVSKSYKVMPGCYHSGHVLSLNRKIAAYNCSRESLPKEWLSDLPKLEFFLG